MTSQCCQEKAVLVAVYAERPRRRPPLSEGGHHHHHHHHYHHFRSNVSKNDGGGRGRGYNRRADLLEYSRHLRASAQPAGSASVASYNTSSHTKQLSIVQIPAADRKPKRSSPPTCLDKWEFLIPSFLRSMTALKTTKDKAKKKPKKSVSTATKMKDLVKSLQVMKRNGSFFSKLLRKLQKRRTNV